MDALAALQERVSVAKLTEPAPTPEQCEAMVRAALRAADHGNLQPWRFLLIEGEGLERLGELFARVALINKPESSAVELERFKNMPKRAPMVVVSIAVCQEHPKIPAIEQHLSAGAATQNLINAAYALGLGAIWRTGDMAYDAQVMAGLGLAVHEKIVGFIYLGTPVEPLGVPKPVVPQGFFATWPNK